MAQLNFQQMMVEEQELPPPPPPPPPPPRGEFEPLPMTAAKPAGEGIKPRHVLLAFAVIGSAWLLTRKKPAAVSGRKNGIKRGYNFKGN